VGKILKRFFPPFFACFLFLREWLFMLAPFSRVEPVAKFSGLAYQHKTLQSGDWSEQRTL